MSSGLSELMQKLNFTMSGQTKIGSTTTVNENVDEMQVILTLCSPLYTSSNAIFSHSRRSNPSYSSSSRNSKSRPRLTYMRWINNSVIALITWPSCSGKPTSSRVRSSSTWRTRTGLSMMSTPRCMRLVLWLMRKHKICKTLSAYDLLYIFQH